MMSRDMFDLTNKTAVIVGGGGGIGGASALSMAEFGADIVVADRSLALAEETAHQVERSGGRAIALQTDITVPEQVKLMVERTISEFGNIDILLNSAGATVRKPLLETTLEEWNHVINVNLTGVFHLSQAVGREMIQRQRGKIIHIASTGGIRAGANFTAYGASKAALIHLVKGLALEWAPYRINVNAIAPTATETNFTADFYAQHPDKKQKTIQNHPFGRIGRLDDYVGAAVYLASPASDFVNGEVIVIDSGKTI
ncbi:SDR family NAD(P)-dependent oxidoreductase [Paenibacillus thalictri]|uniref:SDR family oxidoreductase n=1 Tax=Paenibacillus thalictri TaxID=2527873 RepID=A0A4Q9DW32_9BACL|nr:SDR family oxidoreductase [Paenibacillus thalictri]TBL80596.1 SDR family oxidoreductase [Paenibacillus thalictri]